MDFAFSDVLEPPKLVQDKLEDLRVRVHAVMQSVAQWEPTPVLSLAFHELEKSRMWMGTIIREITHKDPYAPLTMQRKHGNTREIEPTVNVASEPFAFPEDELERTDAVREVLDGFAQELRSLEKEWVGRSGYDSRWLPSFWEHAMAAMILSRNYYGLHLSSLR